MRITPLPVSAPATNRQRRKEARPQQLLDAALALFVEKGFAATRSEQVAHRAGVSKGTLYLYYPSKEELLMAVVRENLTTLITEDSDTVDLFNGSAADLLSELLLTWWRRFDKSPAAGVHKIIIAEARNFPAIAQIYTDEVIVRANQLLGRAVLRGVSSGEFRPLPMAELTFVLMAPLTYMCLHQHSFCACPLQGRRLEVESVVRTHIEVALRGLMVLPA